MSDIVTPRLRLIPASAELVRLEIEDSRRFFERLGVEQAVDWPSDELRDALAVFLEQLEQKPGLQGWLSWYFVSRDADRPVLIGNGGFKGPPVNGRVEIGYEVRTDHRCQGFANEAVSGLTAWALGQPDVRRVHAETRTDNLASIGVLRRAGFRELGAGSESGCLLFEKTAS